MIPGTRVSFLLAGLTAYGTVVQAPALGRCLVAVDPQYMQASQGVLFLTIWIATVSLTVVP